MKIDWEHVENTIVAAAITCFEDFAAKHRNEFFYGFFLDCNATYFETLGHFNTATLLRETALDYQTRNAALYPGWSVEQLEQELRWSAGDWGYFEVFNPCDYDKDYNELIGKAISHFHSIPCDEMHEPTVYDQFLEMSCRVALRLQSENAFKSFNTTAGFRVLCVDHDESIEDGERRLQSVRESMKNT
ncbi:MAG TPA: DUF4303 domain-containing protein [Planctomycetaceae bacterium]|nr:DUF4303 domain-containing protein [Planctomycetaceae bacterium]HQZ68438.1 DUF4303 domain-containing protein [Planctomycetaceae bacterium]